jgi:hypothetical protein
MACRVVDMAERVSSVAGLPGVSSSQPTSTRGGSARRAGRVFDRTDVGGSRVCCASAQRRMTRRTPSVVKTVAVPRRTQCGPASRRAFAAAPLDVCKSIAHRLPRAIAVCLEVGQLAALQRAEFAAGWSGRAVSPRAETVNWPVSVRLPQTVERPDRPASARRCWSRTRRAPTGLLAMTLDMGVSKGVVRGLRV